MPQITRLIADGHNPYAAENLPVHTDVYTPLYNIIVAPLTWIFDNSLQLHRVVAGVFIIVSCLICFFATRKAGRSSLHSLAATCLLYAVLLFYSTPVASTNSTGLMFFMATLVIPWFSRFSYSSLAAAALCALLAFYGKQYFIAGAVFLAAYVLLFVSKWRAVVFAAVFVSILVLSLIVVQSFGPHFLNNTIFIPRNVVASCESQSVALGQLVVFCKTYAGLLIILLVRVLYKAYRGKYFSKNLFSWLASLQLNFRSANQPVFKLKFDHFWFCFICATLVVVFFLGRNPGNYMTYFFQLMSPFLLIGGFTFLSKHKATGIIALPLIFYCYFQSYALLPKDFSFNIKNWEKVEKLIQESDEVFCSPILLMSLLDNDKTLYRGGHTNVFPYAEKKQYLPKVTIKDEKVSRIWNDYLRRLYDNISKKKFNLVLLTRLDRLKVFSSTPTPGIEGETIASGVGYFQQFYKLTETIPLSLTKRLGGGIYKVEVWRPKK